MRTIPLLLVILVFWQGKLMVAQQPSEKLDLYIGTYTKPGGSEGIYRSEFDAATGLLGKPELVATVSNPTFLALHPSKPWLYAAVREGDKMAGVVGYALGADGKLSQLGEIANTPPGACHLSLDQTGKCVLVACYSGGSVTSHAIQEDGSVGPAVSTIKHPARQDPAPEDLPPRAHFIDVDHTNQTALVADAGLDKIFLYRLDPSNAQLTPHDPAFQAVAPQSAPRHLAQSANGKLLYVNGEASSTVMVFLYDENTQQLTELQEVSTLPEGFAGKNTTAEIALHPNGRFLYVSNRGHDSIAIFAVLADGRLTALGHTPSGGKFPRHFAIDPSGKYCLVENQNSDNVLVFRVDSESGSLTPTAAKIELGSPVCIQFVPRKPQ